MSDGLSASVLAECANQLSALDALQLGLATASGASLVNLRIEIAAAVSGASSIAQQARVAASGAAADSAAATGAALRSELKTLNDDIFTRRIFDDYLTFRSPEDKEAYLRREAEARRYIEQQLAHRTPEGELNAAGATIGQMLDAHAHGAGGSPEFNERWERLVKTTEQHRNALRTEGHATEEFDRNVTSSVRRYLKEKGLTEAQIDAALAASANPLDAVKPYIQNENDEKTLERDAIKNDGRSLVSKNSITTSVAMPSTPAATGVATVATIDLADVMATFRAAGISDGTHHDASADPASQKVGAKPLSNANLGHTS